MTREEAIHLRPSTDAEYKLLFGMSTLWGALLLWDSFYPDSGRKLDLFSLAGAFLVLLAAAQAAERLFWPIRAAQRTANLSPRARSILRAAKVIVAPLLMLGWVAFDLMSGPHGRYHAGIFWAFWLCGHFFADLLGESLYAQRSIPAEQIHIAPWSDHLKPIQSDQWGQR